MDILSSMSYKDSPQTRTSNDVFTIAMGRTRTFHPIGAAMRKADQEWQEKEHQAWLEKMQTRSGFGLFACRVLHHESFDVCMGLVICFNVAVMVMETNSTAACIKDTECDPSMFLEVLNYLFLAIYSFELLLRVADDRGNFFCRSWNILDFTVVTTGYIGVLMTFLSESLELPGFSMLRIFRVLRLLRAVRLMRFFPALASMISAFMSVIKAMAWGLVLIVLILLVFSIFAVDLVGPSQSALDSTSEWCNDAFSSVQTSWLFFFQIVVTGDSWGLCAIPLIKEHWYLFAVFGGAFCVVELGFMNLVLSAIIDCATESHEQDVEQRIVELRKEKEKAIDKLVQIFEDIDEDNDGQLSLDELLGAFDHNKRLNAIFRLHDICREDMSILFSFMDRDKSGSVNYEEFVTCLRRAMHQDLRMQTMCLKLQLESISSELHSGVHDVKQQLEELSRGLLRERRPPGPAPYERADSSSGGATPGEDGAEASAVGGTVDGVDPPEEPDGSASEGASEGAGEGGGDGAGASSTGERVAALEEPAAGAVRRGPSSWKKVAAATSAMSVVHGRQHMSQRGHLRELEEKAAAAEARCREMEQRYQETQRQCQDAAEAFLLQRGAPRAVLEPPGALDVGLRASSWGAAGAPRLLQPGVEGPPHEPAGQATQGTEALAERRLQGEQELRRRQRELAEALQGLLKGGAGQRPALEALLPRPLPRAEAGQHAAVGGAGWPMVAAPQPGVAGLAVTAPPAPLPAWRQPSQGYVLQGLQLPSGSLQALPPQAMAFGCGHPAWAATLQ